MWKRWMRAALVTVGIGAATPAWSQVLPGQPSRPSLPEPMPIAPITPVMYQGPPTMGGLGGAPGGMAPMTSGASWGPGGPMTSPAAAAGPGGACTGMPELDNNYSAFSAEQPARHDLNSEVWSGCACYYGIGALALARQGLGNGVLAVRDPTGLDTGMAPPSNATVLQSFRNLPPEYTAGVEAELGYHWDCGAIEVSGFYIPRSQTNTVARAPGRIDSFFFNAPQGFTDDTGLWLQADEQRVTYSTQLYGGELNTRWWSPVFSGCHLIAGVRYLDLQERLLIFTDDDVLSAGAPDPLSAANYIYRTHDRIVAPQLGVEVNQQWLSWLGFSALAKGAWGANFLHTDTRLIRQDGLVGFDSSRNTTIFSQVYEAGVFLDFYFGGCCHVRGGYRGLWVVDVPSAVSQVDFNLEHVNGTQKDTGSIFFHGPSASLEVLF